MKKFLTILLFIFLSISASQVFALSEKDIKFPVSELGGCKNEAECKSFCDKVENRKGVCFEFAKKYNLLTQEEIENAEKFTKAASANGGPSFCKQKDGCDIAKYCEDGSHLSECLDFAKENNLISAKDLEQARRVEAVLKKGTNMPGGCNGRNSCFEYCANPSHTDECLKFAQDLGVVTAKEADETKKFVALAGSGQTPGGKKSKEGCLEYCAEPGNLEECLSFAQKAGYLTSAEVETIRKSGGSGPGGCKSKGECEAYCNNPSNQNACLQYAKEHNINVSFNGPGGCTDIDSCTKYCTENFDDAGCKQYASSFKGPGGCSGIASCTEYCKSNPKDSECAKYAGSAGYSGFSGPGGCTDEASCVSYCKSHPDDGTCKQYAGQYGGDEQNQQPQDQQQPQ